MNLFFKPPIRSFWQAILLLLVSIQQVYAEEGPSLLGIVGEDLKYVLTAPARWESNDWQTVGWGSLAVVGTAVVADRPLRDFMCKQSKMDSCLNTAPNSEVKNSFLTTVENFGATYSLGVMGGFYLSGFITNDAKQLVVAQDLVAASVSSAMINQTLKIVANRSRPRENLGNNNFKGYSGLNNNSSFPSGHTTEAFTLASVIATHYDETWVSVTAYSMAGIVGLARMYHDAHWASDVTASAFIGTLVGKTIVKHNLGLRSNKVAMIPIISPDYAGVQVVGVF